MNDLEKRECLFVVGNLPELGAWNHNQAIQMIQENSNQDIPPLEECYPKIPENFDSEDSYRYHLKYFIQKLT